MNLGISSQQSFQAYTNINAPMLNSNEIFQLKKMGSKIGKSGDFIDITVRNLGQVIPNWKNPNAANRETYGITADAFINGKTDKYQAMIPIESKKPKDLIMDLFMKYSKM